MEAGRGGADQMEKRLSNLPLRLLGAVYQAFDRLYDRWHRVEPVGEFLRLELDRHHGPARELADGTRLGPGDPVGRLHLDNRRLLIGDEGRARAFRFAKLLLGSLAELARRVETDPALAAVQGFEGVSWIPPHGRMLGFEIEPLPPGWRAWRLRWHFRLLLWAFHPEGAAREADRLQPHRFWLSRRRLLDHFAGGRVPLKRFREPAA